MWVMADIVPPILSASVAVVGDSLTMADGLATSPAALFDWDIVNTVVDTIKEPMIDHSGGIIYLGLIATALTNYLQTVGQKSIPPSQAAVIYSLDPLYGAFFANLWLGEEIGQRGWCGAALVLLGVLVSAKFQSDTGSSSSAVEGGPVK